MNQQDWTAFHVGQCYRGALALRDSDQRLGLADLQHLRDAHRWLSEALERAEEHEEPL